LKPAGDKSSEKAGVGSAFGLKSRVDPFGITDAMDSLNAAWMTDIPGFNERLFNLQKSLWEATEAGTRGMLDICGQAAGNGHSPEQVLMASVRGCGAAARKVHAAWEQWLGGMVADAPGLKADERLRCRFWIDQAVRAAAPANWLMTNPGAMQRFVNTRGESLHKGLENLVRDLDQGIGLPRLSEEEAFEIGGNIAVTPGQVVHRNALMEVIQYEPATDKTRIPPLVLVPPWINKYYILDLNPASSMVRYLVEQGFTVFMISWRNPTADMRHIDFADYLFRGILEAVVAARTICRVDRVQAAGYCIGGTALAALMAWLNRAYEPAEIPIAGWTLFAALTDFAEPGVLSVFTTERTIAAAEEWMRADGFLDARYIGMVFRLLNPDALIWRCAANNYLCGQKPPRSDMLFWNSDGTRLPEAMCSFYLRNFYLENNLAQKNGLVLGGRPIDLGAVRQPVYIVGAIQDHISPWAGTFKTCLLTGGPARYALSGDGHITGIVNPPSVHAKKKYWAEDIDANTAPDAGLSEAQPRQGSWWTDWTRWLTPDGDARRDPPPLGCPTYPPLGPAPGRYVLER